MTKRFSTYGNIDNLKDCYFVMRYHIDEHYLLDGIYEYCPKITECIYTFDELDNLKKYKIRNGHNYRKYKTLKGFLKAIKS